MNPNYRPSVSHQFGMPPWFVSISGLTTLVSAMFLYGLLWPINRHRNVKGDIVGWLPLIRMELGSTHFDNFLFQKARKLLLSKSSVKWLPFWGSRTFIITTTATQLGFENRWCRTIRNNIPCPAIKEAFGQCRAGSWLPAYNPINNRLRS